MSRRERAVSNLSNSNAQYTRTIWPKAIQAQKVAEQVLADYSQFAASSSSTTSTLSTVGSAAAHLDWDWDWDWFFQPIPTTFPAIVSLAGLAPTGNANAAPEVGFAVVELTLGDFWRCTPPEIRVYDAEDPDPNAPPYFVIRWGLPATQEEASGPPWYCNTPDYNPESTSTPLVPDPTPGIRPGDRGGPIHIPAARNTKVVLWHWASTNTGHVVQEAYISLKKGVFVLPVRFHDVLPFGTDPFDPIHTERILTVGDVFWYPPDENQSNPSANTVMKQADVQFHLVGNTRHYLSRGETADVNTALCSLGWGNSYTQSDSVELYAVDTFDGGTQLIGWGGCRSQGFVAVSRDEMVHPFFPALHFASGRLVAHEFAHYVGNLTDDVFPQLNLMQKPYGGDFPLTQSQIDQVRIQAANKVDANPSTDYFKNQ